MLHMENALHLISLMRSPVSWAKVARELGAALDAEGAYLSAVSLKGFLYDESFPLPAALEAALSRRRKPGLDLALDYPPNFSRLDGRRRAGILIYEADRFPPHWSEAASRHLDLAFVPSRFTLEAAAASGVPRDMLRLAPFGVNTRLYTPDGPPFDLPPGPAFTILAVAAPHVRKGLAELTAALTLAFGPSDDVRLVIKTPPLSSLSRRPWEYKGPSDFLSAPPDPRVTLISQNLSEDEMASLYRAADLFVQPSYGESFGLAPLEAAACGTPVAATAWGGVLEYLSEENSYLVEFDLVDASAFAYDWPPGDTVHMARPRVGHLADVLRRAYANPSELAGKATLAHAAARTFTWRRTARAIIASIGR